MRLQSILAALAATGLAGAAPTSLEEEHDGNFKDEILAAHNFFRRQHGADPFSWNQKLARGAQDWAETCNFSHDSAGENLAAMTGFPGWAAFVNMWGAERTKYNWANPGFSMNTGHFTQVVWKQTRSLGCGWKKCSGGWGKANGFYVVRKYDPAGNYGGQYAQNVGKQAEGKPGDVYAWHE
ncbi:extracellular SCP domain-containing protein Pry1 [Metarhizium album ARSEF 1941]|uniref:Extracellular SCP domain-containing protein Pry1 n=1 Tax=Metarhizium album (strain ARSEF 1941) TaxID=1081103 RepID=A0A0B2X0W1_METAS|nr:extracellular SCP domain-containing protein Pry1 [Metarhizium album ARSEF 1941]KHN98715.1 extracellular SCP domain-containing protein Pry1 [Metarhizium album ARSEF 1941]